MKAVILAAGTGSRMGDLTASTPKPLLIVGDKPIIEHVLESLPQNTEEIIVVVRGETKDLFVSKLGNSFKLLGNNVGIQYCIQDPEFAGTYGGLHAAKELLLSDQFLVLNGDDIIDPKSLNEIVKYKLAIGLYKQKVPSSKYFVFDISTEGKVLKMRRPSEEELTSPQLVATGTYMLNPDIWDLEPAHLKGNEYGLPQTLESILTDFNAVVFNKWLGINTPEHLEQARQNY